MPNANKKNKMGEETDSDFDAVRQYILACPHVSSEHPAILAAIKGIEQEMKRRERDAKLRQKFMQDAVTIEKPAENAMATTSANTNTNERQGTSFSSSTNIMQTTLNNNNNNNTDQADETMTDDWHDVNSDTEIASGSGSPKDSDPANSESQLSDEATSFLGKGLSRQAISAIAQHQVQVKSPLEAVALALHAAMRSETLGFGCTGVPDGDDSAGAAGGFAAPIRELPKTQFLPRDWDRHTEKVTLRYRKNGTGSLILKVVGQLQATAQEKDTVVEVTLYPTSTGEPPSESLVFPISDHINLDSWARALRDNGTVPPALHYKGLSMLLSNFCQTFDLGTVSEDQDTAAAEQARMYVDTTIGNPSSMQRQQQQQQQRFQQQFEQQANNPANFQSGPPMRPAVAVNRQPWDDDGRSPTIDSAFPGLRVRGPPGNFAGDLAPGGIQGPNFGQFDPGMGGMLMGPNHPAFNGGAGGISGVGPNSGMGMRPRFDPFGPPGGPQDPNNPNNGFPPGDIPNGTRPSGNRRPGGSGNPNPDHMRPPNNLNNNMFG
jgi:hypothetical protein